LHQAAVANGKIKPTVLVQGNADNIAFPDIDRLFGGGSDPAVRVPIINRKLEPIDVHPMQVDLASAGSFDLVPNDL